MTPAIGSELDAAVLRIIGWEFGKVYRFGELADVCRKGAGCCWDDIPRLSTDPNGHEALRLCGPWLDEHCEWMLNTQRLAGKNNCVANAWCNEEWITQRCATRAEAICRLVLAIHEQENTNPPRAT